MGVVIPESDSESGIHSLWYSCFFAVFKLWIPNQVGNDNVGDKSFSGFQVMDARFAIALEQDNVGDKFCICVDYIGQCGKKESFPRRLLSPWGREFMVCGIHAFLFLNKDFCLLNMGFHPKPEEGSLSKWHQRTLHKKMPFPSPNSSVHFASHDSNNGG